MKSLILAIIKMIGMKRKSLWIIGIFMLLMTIWIASFLTTTTAHQNTASLSYSSDMSDYVLIEKNNFASYTSYLYKDHHNNYVSKIWESNHEITIADLIKNDQYQAYQKKINNLLYLKHSVYEHKYIEYMVLFHLENLIYYPNQKLYLSHGLSIDC